jgi:arylsulfatase A-like enzyme
MRILGCIVLGVLAAVCARAEEATKPNIVLFLVDDMGWQDTSVPFWEERTLFNDHFRTPNMERLARLGVKFTHARAHAVCSPTRTSIMTGQSPVRHHVTNWTLRADKDQSGDWGPSGPPANWRLEGLQPEDATLPALLQEAGYYTIHAGKAHWGAIDTPGSDPRNLGFDVNIAGHSAGGPGSYQGVANFGNKEKGGHTLPWGVPGLEKYHGQDIHLTDATTREAKKAVRHAVEASKPFYLYLAHYAVHAPIQPHKRFMENYTDRHYPGTDRDIPPEEEQYASMVEGMDASLGDILDLVEELGVAEETLVIFTSDNGGLSAHARSTTPYGTGANTHCWPLKAGKGSAYDGGTRVPFIAAWAKPDKAQPAQAALPIAPGSVSRQPMISEDLFPTLLAVAGATDPLPEDYPLDGRDLRPYLKDEAYDPDRALYFHYPHVWGPRGPGYEPHSAAVFGNWKVIYFYNPRRWELYNLAEDVGEDKNLAETHPEKLAELAARMRTAFTRMEAQWPVDRDTGEPTPPEWPQATTPDENLN